MLYRINCIALSLCMSVSAANGQSFSVSSTTPVVGGGIAPNAPCFPCVWSSGDPCFPCLNTVATGTTGTFSEGNTIEYEMEYRYDSCPASHNVAGYSLSSIDDNISTSATTRFQIFGVIPWECGGSINPTNASTAIYTVEERGFVDTDIIVTGIDASYSCAASTPGSNPQPTTVTGYIIADLDVTNDRGSSSYNTNTPSSSSYFKLRDNDLLGVGSEITIDVDMDGSVAGNTPGCDSNEVPIDCRVIVQISFTPCLFLADMNGDNLLTPGDFTAWLDAYNNGDPLADQNGDGAVTPTDFTAWQNNYNNSTPCP